MKSKLFIIGIILTLATASARAATATPPYTWHGDRWILGDLYVGNVFGNVSGATITDVSNQIPQDDLEYVLSELWYRLHNDVKWEYINFNDSTIDSIADVDITGATGGKILKFNSSGVLVVSDDSMGDTLSASVLNDLGDVTISGVVDQEILSYDSVSGQWINRTKTELGLDTTEDLVDDSVSASELEPVWAGKSPGILIRSASGVFDRIDNNSSNWNTAYSWGNHATVGYITDGNTNWDNQYGFISDPNDSVSASELEPVWAGSLGIMIHSASGVFTTTPNNQKQWDTAYNNIIQYASNWQTAYSDRLKWDGGSIGLNAATGRTSLQLDSYYAGIEHNHGTGTTNYVPIFSNGSIGSIANGGMYFSGNNAVFLGEVRGTLGSSNLSDFHTRDGYVLDAPILYMSRNMLAMAHVRYTVSATPAISVKSLFCEGDTYMGVTDAQVPFSVVVEGTFPTVSAPYYFRPFVYMHLGGFGSITVDIKDGNGNWLTNQTITNNNNLIWIGKPLGNFTQPLKGIRFTLNNPSVSPVYIRDLGLYYPRAHPWQYYVFNEGDTIYGALNFKGVTNDLTTPAGEHLAIIPGTGGNVGIKTSNPAYDLDVNGTVRMNKLVGIGADNSVGTITFQGTKGGYAGINFRNASDLNLGSFLLTTQYGGVYNSADTGWVWRFNNGVLDVGNIASAQQIADITTYVDNEVDRLLVANNAITLSYSGAGNTLSISARYDGTTIKTNIDNQMYVNPGEIPFSGLKGVSVGGVTDNQILKYVAGSWIAAATAADDDSLKTVDWDNFVDRTSHHIDMYAKELGGIYILDGYSTNDLFVRADGKLRFFDDSPVGTPGAGSFGGEYYNGNYLGQWWDLEGNSKYTWKIGAIASMILSATDLNMQNHNISSANDVVANGAVFAKNRHYAWDGTGWAGGVSSGGIQPFVTALRWNGGTLQYKTRTIGIVNGIVTWFNYESDWTNVP